MKHAARKIAVLAATAFALASPAVQAASGWGLSASEFAEDGNETLRAAGYAFSIWSVIYAGLVAFAVYQLLPRADGSAAVRRAAWPAAAALVGIGAWIWASAADLEWVTVAVIVASAAAAVAALALAARSSDRLDRALAVWPLGALAGWLTIASAINILTSMTAEGLIAADRATAAGLTGIAAVVLVALAVLWRTRAAVYGLPVAWGLVAVWVAERSAHPVSAWAALGAAAAVLLAAGASAARR